MSIPDSEMVVPDGVSTIQHFKDAFERQGVDFTIHSGQKPESYEDYIEIVTNALMMMIVGRDKWSPPHISEYDTHYLPKVDARFNGVEVGPSAPVLKPATEENARATIRASFDMYTGLIQIAECLSAVNRNLAWCDRYMVDPQNKKYDNGMQKHIVSVGQAGICMSAAFGRITSVTPTKVDWVVFTDMLGLVIDRLDPEAKLTKSLEVDLAMHIDDEMKEVVRTSSIDPKDPALKKMRSHLASKMRAYKNADTALLEDEDGSDEVPMTKTQIKKRKKRRRKKILPDGMPSMRHVTLTSLKTLWSLCKSLQTSSRFFSGGIGFCCDVNRIFKTMGRLHAECMHTETVCENDPHSICPVIMIKGHDHEKKADEHIH